MNISVIGTGYVGLVTGTCFAETGNRVVCMDVDSKKIGQLKKGKSPIYEPGLDALLEKNIKTKRLLFTTSLKEAVHDSDVIFLCLPTPPGQDGSADLTYVLSVSEEIAKHADGFKLVITKSTVPIGTGDKIRDIFRSRGKNELVEASNPEFLKEGNAIQDFMFPDRVVLGVEDEKAELLLRELYEPFVRTGAPILIMETRSAEMVKYAANAFLATRISFMNEIARLCEKLGADVDKVRMAIGYDNRIGQKFLFPGIGWGGSCFPKDVKALIKIGEEVSVETPVVSAVNAINDRQKGVLSQKVREHFGANLKGKNFAVWGLSFKPKTDDMREAPSIIVMENLLRSGAVVSAFDPVAMENAEKIFGKRISYGRDQYAVLRDADALLLITEWQEFREPDFGKMKVLMRHHVIFDGRNIYNAEKVRSLGFEYYGIGRK
jgi:UDPglucose 6-dehydrogenase